MITECFFGTHFKLHPKLNTSFTSANQKTRNRREGLDTDLPSPLYLLYLNLSFTYYVCMVCLCMIACRGQRTSLEVGPLSLSASLRQGLSLFYTVYMYSSLTGLLTLGMSLLSLPLTYTSLCLAKVNYIYVKSIFISLK